MHLLGVKKKQIPKNECMLFKHIQEGSYLIHDKERGHYELVELLSLTSENYVVNQLQNLEDKNNLLNLINH